MVQPIDYMGALPQVDLGQSLLSGLQAGSAIRQARQQSQAEEQAQATQAAFRADLQTAFDNPSARSFAALTAKYPGMKDAIGESYKLLDEDQKNAEFTAGTQVYNALKNGDSAAANAVLDQHIAAMKNSGQDTSDLEGIKAQIGRDPKSAQGYVGMVLAAADGPRWDSVVKAEAAPYELTEKQANAHKAAVAAKYAESSAAQDLAKKGWDIAKIQDDIAINRQNVGIAALNAKLKNEENQLKRDQLQQKIDDAKAARDAKTNELVSTVESGRSTIDNFLNTADSVLKTDRSTVESATGTISSKLPTIDQDVADFEETLKTLSSQAFLSQVPAMKGLGALTEAEGKKLEASLANLSTRQSPDKLLANVQEAQRLMLKARANLSTKYGVPDVMPDRPNVPTAQANPSGFRVLGVE